MKQRCDGNSMSIFDNANPEYKLRLGKGWYVKIWINGRIYERLDYFDSMCDAQFAFNEWIARKRNR